MKLLILLLSFFVPLSASFQEGINQAAYYETPAGHLLRYAHFTCPEPKATVFFIQGRGTFLEFYEALITPLLERGYDVWMYDLSGQGGSERLLSSERHDAETVQQLQHTDSFDLYIADAQVFLQDVVLPQAQGELLLAGYSTGGHIALRLLQTPHPFSRAFFFSPLLALKSPLSPTTMSHLFWALSPVIDFERYWPGTGHTDPIYTTPFEQNGYTSDEEAYEEMQNYCIEYRSLVMGGPSIGWIKSAFDSLCLLWENPKAIDIPVLIATGGSDTIVDVSQNSAFVQQLSQGQHIYYPTGRHELFRETPAIRAALWHNFDEFICTNCSSS